MKKFSDLGVEAVQTGFVGQKIPIDDVLDTKLIVHQFKVNQSKYERGSGICLKLQIELEGKKRIVFTGSTVLKGLLEQIKPTDFPFEATIIKKDKQYLFS